MTMYRVGPAGIPASLKTNMDAVLNKKFGTSTTYAPATWPDNVNLLGPLPEKTASGSVASITDGADGVPIKAWKVTLPASLSGYSAINGTKNTGTGTPETQYIVSLGRTIYGGQVDAVNGTGTYNCARIKFSDLNWTYYTAGTNPIFYANNVPNMKTYSRGAMPNIIIDGYTTRTAHSRSNLATNMANMECSAIENGPSIAFRNVDYTSVSAMLADLGNEYIVYEVETPTDFTFTPITPTPETALGVNNFWADEGDSDVTYRADINMLIASLSGNRGLMMSRPQLEEITEETKEDPEVTEK